MGLIMSNRDWYTQREWDRTVGWGTVPEEYRKPKWALFDYREEDPYESWDMFCVRKLREQRQYREKLIELQSTNFVRRWFGKIFRWYRERQRGKHNRTPF